MASLDEIAAAVKADIIAALAPLQPNIPPTYPNSDPRAGTIAPTLVTTGEPLQYYVLERLENHYAQVAVFFANGKVKPMPYTNASRATIKRIVAGQGTYNLEVGRGTKDMTIEVWAYDNASRAAIGDAIAAHFGDVYRVTGLSDGTTALMRFEPPMDHDNEQLDSVYIREFTVNVDFTLTEQYDVATVIETTLHTTLPDGTVVTQNDP